MISFYPETEKNKNALVSLGKETKGYIEDLYENLLFPFF